MKLLFCCKGNVIQEGKLKSNEWEITENVKQF